MKVKEIPMSMKFDRAHLCKDKFLPAAIAITHVAVQSRYLALSIALTRIRVAMSFKSLITRQFLADQVEPCGSSCPSDFSNVHSQPPKAIPHN